MDGTAKYFFEISWCNFGIRLFLPSSLDIWNFDIYFWHSNSDIYLWHLNFDIYFFLIFFIWTVNLLEFFFFFFSSLLSFLSLFFEPTDFEMAIWWTFLYSNVPVVVPVGDASQLCPGLEIYQNHKYLPSCLVTCQQLAPTEDAAFWTAA